MQGCIGKWKIRYRKDGGEILTFTDCWMLTFTDYWMLMPPVNALPKYAQLSACRIRFIFYSSTKTTQKS